jgi:hypothetical protein
VIFTFSGGAMLPLIVPVDKTRTADSKKGNSMTIF